MPSLLPKKLLDRIPYMGNKKCKGFCLHKKLIVTDSLYSLKCIKYPNCKHFVPKRMKKGGRMKK